MVSTAHEALIAELLGDVGKLHDEIKALPKTLAAPIEAISSAANRVASKGETTINLDEAIKSLKYSAEVHELAVREKSRQWRKWLIAVIVTAFLASFCGSFGAYFLLGKIAKQTDEKQIDLEQQAEVGRAVGSIWEKLDSKTKEQIHAAINKQR